MCGIAGLLAPEFSAEQAEVVASQMISVLHHRGPDDCGIWRSQSANLVLGHKRLAIQDLSDNGKQPMLSKSKRYCVVFNGEIYNFRQIASELRKRGYQFSGHSDTEVMLTAIEEWGITDAIKKFIGMFSFALWDRKHKVIHLCRDRLGEKPLYYGWLGKVFYFASELKAIENVVPKALLDIDFDALSGFLKNGFISAPYSIYRHVHKLIPGTVLSIPILSDKKHFHFSPWSDSSSLCPITYWSVLNTANQGLSNLITNENEAIEELDNALHRSVRMQMIADVKIGTFLSGGIDSSIVSAIAQNVSGEKVRTFTIGFSDKDYDESPYAEMIASHLGTDHLTMHVTAQDALEVVPNLASIYDEPFADSSQIPSYLVSKLAREHVKVCLSGDGGDELFAGYNRYLWTQSIWSKLSIFPKPMRQTLGKVLSIAPPIFWDRLYQGITHYKFNSYEKQKLVGLKVQKLAGFMQQPDIYQAYKFLLSYWTEPEKLITKYSSTEKYKTNNIIGASNFIDHAMFMDQTVYLPGDCLTKVDRASMAVSLETRLPLLNHETVELSWRIPSSMKVKDNISKWVLRKVLYKYIPQEMIDRPKMGFSVPISQWLRKDLKIWAEDLLATIDTSRNDILQKQTIQDIWEQHISEKRDHSQRLWTILMFLSWINNRDNF